LNNIYEMHGDWHLALASYNWGEHAVARAIAKNQAKSLPTDYASLTMPIETRYYVPKLQALKNIVAHPEYFDFRMPPLANQAYFESVTKPERIDVAVAARLAEMPLEEFIALNPAYHRPVIHGDRAGPLLLPADRIETFIENLAQYEADDKPLSNWLTYTLKKGDSLAKIAATYRIAEARLRQINGITPRVRVGPGFTLLVPRPGSTVNPDSIASALPKEATAKNVAVKGITKPAVKKAAPKSRPKGKTATAKKKPPPKK
jgi:membrane-bound lytic murein transglycosylase D